MRLYTMQRRLQRCPAAELATICLSLLQVERLNNGYVLQGSGAGRGGL